NTASLGDHLLGGRVNPSEAAMLMHGINAYAPEFSAAGQTLWQLAGLPKSLHPSLQVELRKEPHE
ncbi:MAG: hypothetical protein JNK57_19490, partial [Planctomycetaceae bacterium]|nr:hypothetical protein [Planctomycetaceae bacterium]